MRIARLRDTHSGSVPQPQFLGDIQIVRNGQDAASRLDAVFTDHHGAIVEGTVLEEDIFNQSLVDIGIDDVARAHHVVKRHVMLNHNQRPHLLLTHAHAGHHDGQHIFMPQVLLLGTGEEAYQRTGILMRTQRQQEAANLLLEDDNQGYHTHTDQFIEDGPQQPHLQHLRHHQPEQDKDQDARKDIDRPRSLHQLIAVVEQEGY